MSGSAVTSHDRNRIGAPVTSRPSNYFGGGFKFCAECGQAFRAYHFSARYCSPACKQAAYRRRHDPDCNTTARRRARAQRAARTRQAQTVEYVCAECGKTAYRSNAEGNRLYCSDACKQRAYRARRKESHRV